jgi:septal ring factor EnvC (AmiA/AmiB activator)
MKKIQRKTGLFSVVPLSRQFFRQEFLLRSFVALIGAVLAINVNAASVDSTLDASAKKTAKAQQSQQKIDNLSDQTTELFQTFKQVNKQVEGLRVYNAQLEAQVEHQRKTMADLEASIENAAIMERQITPLTLKMIDSLDQFVNLDLPFLLDERKQRVTRLRENLNRSDLSAAEKFRQVLEAYKIESEYGTRIDSYTDMVNVSGQDREVNILRVGRIALLYQTANQQYSGVWNRNTKQWQPLDGSDEQEALAKGIRMANKQVAVDMLELPISTPEAIQ